jgi:hypothetical protein
MNSYGWGKLAEIHIQSLMDAASEGREARGASSPRRASRPRHHFHWHKHEMTSLYGAMAK